MTKDKARKAAARARAAHTGERYVAALRAVDQRAATPTPSALHRLMHRLPGVAPHVDGGLPPRRNRPHRVEPRVRRRSHQTVPHHGDPRVLVGWQNRIARLMG